MFHNECVAAFVSPKWWVNNPEHVIIIPNRHYENLYEIPDELLSRVYIAAKQPAIAMRDSYPGRTGTSTRQHNEPDGNQDVWHFHTHLFPRFANDQLSIHQNDKRFVPPVDRKVYADMLMKQLQTIL